MIPYELLNNLHFVKGLDPSSGLYLTFQQVCILTAHKLFDSRFKLFFASLPALTNEVTAAVANPSKAAMASPVGPNIIEICDPASTMRVPISARASLASISIAYRS